MTMKKHSTSELIAECCVCGKHVPFNDGDRNDLLQHSKESHHGERVVRYDILKKGKSTGRKSKQSNSNVASSGSRSRGSLRKRSSEDKKEEEDGDPNYNFGHRMVCSSCGHVGAPLLRRRGKTKAQARLSGFTGCCPLLAMMLFFCCFTPRIAHLYCSRCKRYLGTYNTRNGQVTTVKDEG